MKKVIFTFGRMNPPTVGHQKLVDKVMSVAKSEQGEPRIYLSHTQNNKKDPLTYDQKIKYATKAFGKPVTKTKSKTVFQIVEELEKAGFTDVVMVVGGDRVSEFDRLLKKYNGKNYNFESIKVISAGQRDPDAQGVEGMSASKLRGLAKEGDFDTFKKGLAKKLSDRDAKEIYDIVRDVITEELDEVMTHQQRLARGRQMKRLAPKLARLRKIKRKRKADAATLQKRAAKAAIQAVRKKLAGERGKNYKALSPSEKITIDKMVQKKQALVQKLAKKLLPKVRQSEAERVKKAREMKKEDIDFDALFEAAVAQDKDIKDREGTQPAKYHKGLSKSTKSKRDAFFKKGVKKDDDDDSAYKPAPGDADAKTKTSKHTKKYHDMFGESAVKRAKEVIKREKESDERKHDAILDRARTQDTQKKNAQTEDSCWQGYTQKGMKKKGDKMVPNCVPEEYELSEDATAALKKKSEKSGISLGILRQVYNRGMAAWKTGHRPGATQQQWGFARVNSFITGGKTRTTADKDLWSKHKGKSESVDLDALGEQLDEMRRQSMYDRGAETQTRTDKSNYDKIAGQRSGVSKRFFPGSHGVVVKQIERAKHILDDLKGKRAKEMEVPQKAVNDLQNLIAQIKRETSKLRGTTKDIYAIDEETQSLDESLDIMFAQEFMEMQGGYAHHPDVQKKLDEVDSCCDDCDDIFEQVLEEAEYQGKKVTLNDPIRTSENPNKKFKVYVRNDQGNVVVVRFGDPNMEIKRDDPDRRKSFRARHGCDNPGPKWKAKYWSCWQWRAGAKVDN